MATINNIRGKYMSRKIDALVAEHVMSLDVWMSPDLRDSANGGPIIHNYTDGTDVPLYSTDIAAAWEVVEKAINMEPTYDEDKDEGFYGNGKPPHDWSLTMNKKEKFVFRIGLGQDVWVGPEADTAPMAICLAALKLKGVDVENLVNEETT